MKELRYRSHALDRMAERQIPQELVEEILQNPDGEIKQSLDKRIIYREIDGRLDNLIAVVAIEKGSYFDIITTMINFEVKK